MKFSDVFDTETCGRCGGGGKYSYNLKDGDMCYGCNGSGWVFTKKAAPFVAEATETLRTRKAPVVGKLEVGDRVAASVDSGTGRMWMNHLYQPKPQGSEWATVVRLADTDEWCGSSSINGVKTDHYSIDVTVEFDDGRIYTTRMGRTTVARRASPGLAGLTDLLDRWTAAPKLTWRRVDGSLVAHHKGGDFRVDKTHNGKGWVLTRDGEFVGGERTQAMAKHRAEGVLVLEIRARIDGVTAA